MPSFKHPKTGTKKTQPSTLSKSNGYDDSLPQSKGTKKRTRPATFDLENAADNLMILDEEPSKEPATKKRAPNNFLGRADTSQQVKSRPSLDTAIKAPIPVRARNISPILADGVIKAPIPVHVCALKTSILLNHSLFSSESDSGSDNESEIARQLDEKFKTVESYQPIIRILSHTPGGTPSSVAVEGDKPGEEEVLTMASHLGAAVIFSNNPEHHPINQQTVKTYCSENPILEPEALAKVTPAVGKFKAQETTITRQSLEQTQRENKARSGRRLRSQNKTIAAPNVKESEASASKYAAFVETSSEHKKWEWLHMIAHRILGQKSQTPENLVAGTNHANTEMLVIIEQHLKLISDAYPDGFELKTWAQLNSKNVPISKSISYTIVTPDFTLPLIFNAQTKNKPHTDYGKYFKVVIEQLLELAQARHLASSREPVITRTKTPNIVPPFFAPKPFPATPEKANATSIITPSKKSGVDQLAKRAAENASQINDPSSYDRPVAPPTRPSTPTLETEDDLVPKLTSPSRGFLRRK